MSSKSANAATVPKTQDACIDLPGEAVKCWRSSDHIRVILRKHRDVIFDINLSKDAIYTVESTSDFYSPREKKLLRRAAFFDGERFHIWVGREFRGLLILKLNDTVIGRYEVNKLDTASYGADPKTKPEPLLIVMGQKQDADAFTCTPNDPLGIGRTQLVLSPTIVPRLQFLTKLGSQFDYTYSQETPEVKEYVIVTEVGAAEIQPQVLKQLESSPVTGRPTELFAEPKQGSEKTLLYKALGAAATNIAGNETITSNWFKETAGYLLENFRSLNKIAMTVRIEKKAKGKYRALIKGKPMTQLVAQSLGAGKAKVEHHRSALGAEKSRFIDGGFGKAGKAGYGGARRMVMTASENFRGGMKIQVIGTVIDLFVDANSVFFDERGSGDLSEFLGRAGVSIAKAGATAALGSIFAAAGTAFVTSAAVALSATGAAVVAPVIAVVAVVVGGYILAATIVDYVDNELEIKEKVAKMAR
jgi:hypothetical protein